jgi:hypothetical protein
MDLLTVCPKYIMSVAGMDVEANAWENMSRNYDDHYDFVFTDLVGYPMQKSGTTVDSIVNSADEFVLTVPFTVKDGVADGEELVFEIVEVGGTDAGKDDVQPFSVEGNGAKAKSAIGEEPVSTTETTTTTAAPTVAPTGTPTTAAPTTGAPTTAAPTTGAPTGDETTTTAGEGSTSVTGDTTTSATESETSETTESTTTETESAIMKGDVNGDGVIDLKDVTLTLRVYLEKITLDKLAVPAAADVNGDEKVDLKDVIQILHVYTGKLDNDFNPIEK